MFDASARSVEIRTTGGPCTDDRGAPPPVRSGHGTLDPHRVRNEARLDALPRDTARAVRELSDYQWRSPEAQQAYDEIQDLLRREVLDSQFRGMKEALQNASPEDMQAVKDMLATRNKEAVLNVLKNDYAVLK